MRMFMNRRSNMYINSTLSMKNLLIFLIPAMLFVYGCGNDDYIDDSLNSSSGDTESKIDSEVEKLSQSLFGTSWMHFKTVDGGSTRPSNGRIFTFTDEVAGKNLYWYSFDGIENAGLWVVDENGVYIGSPNQNYCGYYYLTASEVGAIVGTCCASEGTIIKQNSSELVIQDEYKTVYFISAQETDNNGSDGASGAEKPDVGFYDFTATRSSLKIQYKIYNNDEAKVSSAKIYYGTGSNPSDYKAADVSGTMITANLTGLKPGTTYYIKCRAIGRGGTTTTSTTKVITDY